MKTSGPMGAVAKNPTLSETAATPLLAANPQDTTPESTLRRLQMRLVKTVRTLINLNRRYREQQDQLNQANAYIDQLESSNARLQENNALLRWHNKDLMQQYMLLKGLVPHPEEGGDSNFVEPQAQRAPASAARSQQSQHPHV